MEGTSSTIVGDRFEIDLFFDPYNKRMRIDDLRGNVEKGIEKVTELAKEKQIEKLIVIARTEQIHSLIQLGFQWEGTIDEYFLGSDGHFFCKYFSLDRFQTDRWMEEDDILHNVYNVEKEKLIPPPPDHYVLKMVTKTDKEKLAKLYQTIFKIYPTPLHDPNYIAKTMDEGVVYYGFFVNGLIVSAASADINHRYKNAELTDCATLPDHRKHGLMKILLQTLENHLVNEGIYCAYSIARAQSFGMNAALFQLGYNYRGRLKNNCYIYDKIENMNLWVKTLHG